MNHNLNIVRIIGSYLTLRQQGSRHTGLCPFHADKKPSLQVSEAKGLFHCFACGAGGDALTFLMKYHGCNFAEARRMAGLGDYTADYSQSAGIGADRTGTGAKKRDAIGIQGGYVHKNDVQGGNARGVEAISFQSPGNQPSIQSATSGTPEAADSALAGDPATAAGDPATASATAASASAATSCAAYLRQLTPYTSDHPALQATYARFGVSLAPQHTAQIPDAFRFTRGRLIFPLFDTDGTPIGFAARRIDTEGIEPPPDSPKYINPRNGGRYHKSTYLYGAHIALPAARTEGCLLVCEGYKDALALQAAGLTASVALCGTGCSDEQLRMICAAAPHILLLMDADSAGQNAAEALQQRLTAAGREVTRVIPDAPAKDPDEWFRQIGPEALAARLLPLCVHPRRRTLEQHLAAALMQWAYLPSPADPAGSEPYVRAIHRHLEVTDRPFRDPAARAALLSLAGRMPPSADVIEVLRTRSESLDRLLENRIPSGRSPEERRTALIHHLLHLYLEYVIREELRTLKREPGCYAVIEELRRELLESSKILQRRY